MPDEMDQLQDFNDKINADAYLEHQRKMADMEFVKLEEGTECCECGRKIGFTTKARKDSGLCGECWDYYNKGKNVNKFREGY